VTAAEVPSSDDGDNDDDGEPQQVATAADGGSQTTESTEPDENADETNGAFELPDADATGPLPDARRLKVILEENGGRMSRSDLFGRAAKAYDMAPDDAERALEKGRENGLLTPDGDTIESV